MRKLRVMIGHFEHSTQATAKLLSAQAASDSPAFKDKAPRKLLQDVVTRWWSTFRALRRARILSRIIQSLVVLGEIDCELPTPAEWAILHQTELALETMAHFQEALEGEKYVTASLVPIAVFQVRKNFLKVINNQDTLAPVRDLTRILLADFDKRYVPTADDSGTKLSFKWGASVGARNRYNTVHHFFFVAAFLDPRVKKLLKKLFMTDNDYQLLRREIRKLMEAEAVKQMGRKGGSNEDQHTETPIQTEQHRTSTSATITPASAKTAIMFDGLIDMDDEEEEDDDEEEGESFREMANEELDRFDKIQILPLVNPDGSYVNPLPWWRENTSRFPLLSELAHVYLAIPATSAPSERVWSRASRILTCKRSVMKPEVAQGMMFLMENSQVLHKHYQDIARKYRKKELHHLISMESQFLPRVDETDGGVGIFDVGQQDSSAATNMTNNH